MPVEIGLSKYALDLLRSRVDGGGREVDDSNREAYGELERRASCTRCRGLSADRNACSAGRMMAGNGVMKSLVSLRRKSDQVRAE